MHEIVVSGPVSRNAASKQRLSRKNILRLRKNGAYLMGPTRGKYSARQGAFIRSLQKRPRSAPERVAVPDLG